MTKLNYPSTASKTVAIDTHLSEALAGLLCGLQRGGDVTRAQAVVDHGPYGDTVDEAVLQAGVGAGGDLDV